MSARSHRSTAVTRADARRQPVARTGAPSRSEVTDAAMGRRAECVMLNKGPYIVDAIAALDSILARMGGHVEKKRSLLRRLRAWEDALED